MSFRGEIMRKRLNRCEDILRPPGSFAARLHALCPEYRRIYEAWKMKQAEYWSQWSDEDPYRVLIGEICPLMPEPALPFYVQSELYPPVNSNLSAQKQYEQLLESINGKKY